MEADKKVAQESLCCVLNMLQSCMPLMVHMDKVSAVGTTNKAAMGYYLIKGLSEPYTLHEDTGGMSGMIPARSMVVDALYFNRVQCTPLWYMPSGNTMA
jgi:hypothetical protein